jgi:hypothetical protein
MGRQLLGCRPFSSSIGAFGRRCCPDFYRDSTGIFQQSYFHHIGVLMQLQRLDLFFSAA